MMEDFRIEGLSRGCFMEVVMVVKYPLDLLPVDTGGVGEDNLVLKNGSEDGGDLTAWRH